MKFALLLPDGAADDAIDSLDGKTALEAASTPNMDWISTEGRVGLARTCPGGMTPGSDVCTLSLVGYDPKVYHTGRAPIEAVARQIELAPDEVVFRCNLVTIIDDVMEDFSAGHISQAEAEKLVNDLQAELGDDRITFHVGVGYRHLMTIKDAAWMKLECTPPHDIPGQDIAKYLPTGKGSDEIKALMARSREILENHDVNQVRRDLGESPATSIWLWGEGTSPTLPSFQERFGVTGAAITAVDLIRGVARSLGWRLIEVEGANGYIDTNYAGKGEAAVAALDEVDLIAVHVEAPDEMGHNGDVANKVKAIELIDEHVVKPVLDKLRTFDEWRVLCMPDHPTPVATRTHSADPPPFCMAGTGITPDRSTAFNEQQATEGGLVIDPGHELMEFFIKSGRPA